MDLQFNISEILKAIETHSNNIWFTLTQLELPHLFNLNANESGDEPNVFTQKKTGPKQIDPGMFLLYPQDHHMPLILINLIRAPEQDYFK